MQNYNSFFKNLFLPLVFFLGTNYVLIAGIFPPIPSFNTSLLILILYILSLGLTLILDRSHYFLILLFGSSIFFTFFLGGFPAGSNNSPLIFPLILVFWGNFFYLALSRDRGIFSSPGKRRLVFFFFQLVALPLFIFPNQEYLTKNYYEILNRFGSPHENNLLLLVLVSGFFFFLLVGLFRKNSLPITLGTVFSLTFFPCLFSDNGQAFLLFHLSLVIFVILKILIELYGMAYLDDLTGLPSRRSLKQDTQKLSGPYSIAMVDIDHFKKVNDRYGHATGDQVLRYLSALLQKTSGPGKPYRFGGEEFALIFPGLPKEEAVSYLEDLKWKMAENPFSFRGRIRIRNKKRKNRAAKNQRKIKITASMGLADNKSKNNPQEVIKTADEALYRAKNSGRNRIIVSP